MRAFQISALVETAVRDERERGIIRSKALEDAAWQALEALETVFMPFHPAVIALRAALGEPVVVKGELPPRYVARYPTQAERDYQHLDQTITALRAALAEPVSKAQS